MAAAAGITTSALYHYVESKLDLYVAVHRDVQGASYDRFEATPLARLRTRSSASSRRCSRRRRDEREDPLVRACSSATVGIDMRRFPEIAERLARHVARTDRYFLDMIDLGIATGEIAAADRALAAEFLRIVLDGAHRCRFVECQPSVDRCARRADARSVDPADLSQPGSGQGRRPARNRTRPWPDTRPIPDARVAPMSTLGERVNERDRELFVGRTARNWHDSTSCSPATRCRSCT